MIFANIWLRDNGLNTSAKKFIQAIVVINVIVIAQFFEAICTSIFKQFLTVKSTKGRFFRSVLIYFGIVEINGQEMLHLHCFELLCRVFHLAKLRSCLQFDPSYTIDMVRFIDSILYYSMANESLIKNINQKALSEYLNKIDKEFALKLYKDGNVVIQIANIFFFAQCNLF